MYPRENARTFYEGMLAAGETEVVTLNRSAWAGSQRYGTAVWSGDIGTDFTALRQQIAAGLNTSASPASPGGPPTSAASMAATPTTRPSARC